MIKADRHMMRKFNYNDVAVAAGVNVKTVYRQLPRDHIFLELVNFIKKYRYLFSEDGSITGISDKALCRSQLVVKRTNRHTICKINIKLIASTCSVSTRTIQRWSKREGINLRSCSLSTLIDFIISNSTSSSGTDI